jgi:hypothetical protein
MVASMQIGKVFFVWWGWRHMYWGRSQALEFSSYRAIFRLMYCIGPLEIRWQH